MMNTTSWQQWQNVLNLLRTRRKPLADATLEAAAKLEMTGEPPSEGLIRELTDYDNQFLQLADVLRGSRKSTQGSSLATPSLEDLDHLLQSNLRRRSLVTSLDPILNLIHTETADFAPLRTCQDEVRHLHELAENVSQSTDDEVWQAVEQGTHPLVALLNLTERADVLSDVEWTESNDRVTESYGRQLATAVARGRIVKGTTSATTTPAGSETSFTTGQRTPSGLSAKEPIVPKMESAPLTAHVPRDVDRVSAKQPSATATLMFDEPSLVQSTQSHTDTGSERTVSPPVEHVVTATEASAPSLPSTPSVTMTSTPSVSSPVTAALPRVNVFTAHESFGNELASKAYSRSKSIPDESTRSFSEDSSVARQPTESVASTPLHIGTDRQHLEPVQPTTVATPLAEQEPSSQPTTLIFDDETPSTPKLFETKPQRPNFASPTVSTAAVGPSESEAPAPSTATHQSRELADDLIFGDDTNDEPTSLRKQLPPMTGVIVKNQPGTSEADFTLESSDKSPAPERPPVARVIAPLSKSGEFLVVARPVPVQGATPGSRVVAADARSGPESFSTRNVVGTQDQQPRQPASVRSGSSVSTSGKPSDSVIRLINEDRLPLAMHLTTCAEQIPGRTTPFPPSWLLRAMAYGRHVYFAQGEIARQLEDELRNFRHDQLTAGDTERSVANGLFLRAAALPAALMTASPAAMTILRSFKIEPAFSQFYNYCARIIRYGDRLQGQVGELFRTRTSTHDTKEQAQLGALATSWLEAAVNRATTYARTSPLFTHAHWTLASPSSRKHPEATLLWSKWQEALVLCSRLLRPVRLGRESERNWLKQEVARIQSNIRLESIESLLRSGVPVGSLASGGSLYGGGSKGILLPSEDMIATVNSAIDIANRWLRFSRARTASGTDPLPMDAVELRDEVLQRTNSVVVELNAFSQSMPSPLVRAAVLTCRRSVERIKGIFDGTIPIPTQEPPIRHILNAELLKIPGLNLNDQWAPEVDPMQLERELEQHLERGDVDWYQAYQAQAKLMDHVATGRLLELDAWRDETVHAGMMRQRESQIVECRSLIEHDLNDTAHEVETLSSEGLLDTRYRTAVEQRLERLRSELHRQLNFGSFRWQLDQVRSGLQRSRHQGHPTPAASQTSESFTSQKDESKGKSQMMTNKAGTSSDSSIAPAGTVEIPETTDAANDHVLVQQVHPTDIFSGE